MNEAAPYPPHGPLERRLAFACALLLCGTAFLPLGSGALASGARLALLLFPVAAVVSWLLLPAARTRPPGRRTPLVWLWIGLPMAAYFLSALFLMLLHRDAVSALDKPVRAMLLSAGLFAWLHLRMDGAVFRRVAVAGSVAAGFLALGEALYDRLVLGAERVGVEAFPIQFADMAMSVVLIGIVWAAVLREPQRRTLAVLGTVSASVAVWMAATRGAFLALAVLPWALAYARGTRQSWRLVLGVTASAVLAIAVGMAGSTSLRERMTAMESDLVAYSAGHPVTSLGMRIEMWRNSVRVFTTAPLVGVGNRGYMQAQRDGVAAGRLDPEILIYNGAHNQFIDAMAKGGLLHLLATVGLFLFPWLWFRRQCKSTPPPWRGHAAAGFALASAFPIFSLTQHVLNHGSGPMFYAGGVVLFALSASLVDAPEAQFDSPIQPPG